MFRFLPLDTIEEETAVCGKAPGKGYENPRSWNMLTEKIQIGGPDPLPFFNVTTNTTTTTTTVTYTQLTLPTNYTVKQSLELYSQKKND